MRKFTSYLLPLKLATMCLSKARARLTAGCNAEKIPQPTEKTTI
jgi:hypothetical protein